jgi:hypothetical protein
MGKTEPFFLAQVVPRFLDETEELRHIHPWNHSQNAMNGTPPDLRCDQSMIRQLGKAMERHLK